MDLHRRTLFQTAALLGGLSLTSQARPLDKLRARHHSGWVIGKLTGAQAVVESLIQENVACVYGIPGAQENELWDEFKSRKLPYLLVTHEYSAACMADGYARATGQVGVLAVVPGPGITNALTGLGEAKLDSVPLVAIVGDVSHGPKAKPYQVHSLDNAALLKPVCKCVHVVECVEQIPTLVRQAFRDAICGEPGPVAVVIPFNLFIESHDFKVPPLAEPGLPCDTAAMQKAFALLSDPKLRIGIYAGLGCMDHSAALTALAERLQAPVATSVSGKGAINECHPLAVGWGYGPHASSVAEEAFQWQKLHPLKTGVDCLLAIGVKFSEVSTGYYGNPRPRHVIHVDACAEHLGRVMPADVCVHADAGLFLNQVLASVPQRQPDEFLKKRITQAKCESQTILDTVPAGKCGVDPLALIAALRKHLPCDALLFTDVSLSEHLAAEYYRVEQPRTYFNPVDNQSMGWSIPAAIGAQHAMSGRVCATLTGDGCFLMSAMELSTAAREGIPVKVFVLDDHAYHYMQVLQDAAYQRTTATRLAALDYAAFAKAMGVHYVDVSHAGVLSSGISAALAHPGPVLTRVQADYGKRKIRWIEAVRDRFAKELSPAQKARFLARIGVRSVQRPLND